MDKRTPLGGLTLRRALFAIAVVALLAASVGFAATLPLTSDRMTIFKSAASVPSPTPTVTTCTLTADADAYVDESKRSTNFGSPTLLVVESDRGSNVRSFVRFDVSSCSIPSTTTIRSATLQLFLTQSPSASRTHQVERVTSPWGETTLTWQKQPSVSTTVTATAGTGTASNVAISWSVTSDVQAFVAGGAANHGWRIKDQSEEASTAQRAEFGAREQSDASRRPTLVITY